MCRSFSASPGYSFTVSGSGALSLSGGNVTFSTGMTLTATGNLGFSGNTTITSNGKAWLGNLQPQLPGVYTLSGDFTVQGVSHAVAGNPTAINGGNFNVLGNYTASAGRTISGTSIVRFVGTGTVTVNGTINNSVHIATSGTTTFSTTFSYGNGTLSYISGNTNCTTNNNTLSLAAGCTFLTSGMTWNNILFAGTNQTYTLSSDLNASGTTTLNGTTTLTLNGFKLNTNGLNASGPASGTTNIFIIGTGATLQASGTGLRNNLTINSAGIVTTGIINYNTGTLTYSAGTIAHGPTSILTCVLPTTLNTSGMSWYNVTFSTNASTHILNSNLNVANTIRTSISTTFSGAGGWTCANFSCTTGGVNIRLKTGNTYTITSGMTIITTVAFPIVFSSITPNTNAILTLKPGATQDIRFCDATDIDSSGGQLIQSRKGVLTRATNWKLLTAPSMVSTSY